MFNDLKISTRLMAGFGLMLALLLAVVGMAVWQMGIMRTASIDLASNWLPSVEKTNHMRLAIAEFRNTEFQHVLNTDPSAMSVVEKSMVKALATFDEDHHAYVLLISSDEERKLHDIFAADWKQ